MASSCGAPTVKKSETFYLVFGSDPEHLAVGWASGRPISTGRGHGRGDDTAPAPHHSRARRPREHRRGGGGTRLHAVGHLAAARFPREGGRGGVAGTGRARRAPHDRPAGAP